jgi:hypothetical protein
MSFYQKYELERLIADGEVKTFRATENISGRLVFLHLFNPEAQPVLVALRSRFAQDPLHLTPPLIALGEFAGNPYSVTEPIAPFTNLREWLGLAAAPAPVSIPPIAKPVVEKTDSFARLFADSKPAPAPARSEPGEFTSFFGEAPAASKPQPASGEFTSWFGQPPPPSKSAPPAQTDEFAKMFGAPAQPTSRPPAPASSSDDTSQFTRLFGSGPSGEAINIEEEQARAARNATPESRPFQAPTEFTRVFGPQPGSAPDTQPRLLTLRGASGLFRSARDPKPSKPPVASNEKDPGEYTRMMVRAVAPDGMLPPVPQPLAPAAPKRGPMIALSIVVGVLVVIIVVVVVMALRR